LSTREVAAQDDQSHNVERRDSDQEDLTNMSKEQRLPSESANARQTENSVAPGVNLVKLLRSDTAAK
jgi:hypothetical protein